MSSDTVNTALRDCDSIVDSGCLDGGERWVLAQHNDGSFTLLNANTGAVADPNDIVPCALGAEATSINRQTLVNPWTTTAAIFGTAIGNLRYWHVIAKQLPVTININGVGIAMDDHEVFSGRALGDRVLDDNIIVTIGAAGIAQLVWAKGGA